LADNFRGSRGQEFYGAAPRGPDLLGFPRFRCPFVLPIFGRFFRRFSGRTHLRGEVTWLRTLVEIPQVDGSEIPQVDGSYHSVHARDCDF
jgi:hypothetical protein